MRMYNCVIDDGRNIFRRVIPARNRKELAEEIKGNGDLIKVTDETKEYLTVERSVDFLRETLTKAGYGQPETDLLCRLLVEHQKSLTRKGRTKEESEEEE